MLVDDSWELDFNCGRCPDTGAKRGRNRPQNWSEDVIAATMVALGTSLPELMTAIAAIRKGHPEITIGNIVGANVLNCLFVIGAAAAARPLSIPPNFYSFHFPAMLIILYSFRYFIFRNRDGRFKKMQGAWLLGVYLVYLVLQYVLNIGTVGR